MLSEREFEFLLGLERETRGATGPGFLGLGTTDWFEGGRSGAVATLDRAAADLEAWAEALETETQNSEPDPSAEQEESAEDPEAQATQARQIAENLRLRSRAIGALLQSPTPHLPEDWSGDDPSQELELDSLSSAVIRAHRERLAGSHIQAEKTESWLDFRLERLATQAAKRLGLLVTIGFLALTALSILTIFGRKAWNVGTFAPERDGLDRYHGWGTFALYWLGYQVFSGLLATLTGSPLSGVSAGLASLPLLVLFALGAKATNRPFEDITGLSLTPGRALALTATALSGALVAYAGLIGLSLLAVTFTERDLWSNRLLDIFVGSGPEALPAMFLEAAVWAPIFEELAFRGALFAGLRKRLSFLPAALLSSLVFGLSHGYDFLGQMGIVWVGFVLCWLFERTRSLFPCLLAHALFNAAQIYLLSVFL